MNPASVERFTVDGARRSTYLRSLLAANLSVQGMYSVGFLTRETFLDVLKKAVVSEEAMRKYDVANTKSVVVVALRYGEGEYPLPSWAKQWEPTPDGCDLPSAAGGRVMVRIARFARANWYRELSRRLLLAVAQTIRREAGEGIGLPQAGTWHRLVNSGLPEKPLAERAGLGWMGKNGILIANGGVQAGDGAPPYSSAVVLGLLLCPVELEPDMPATERSLCGECRRCIDACPTGALAGCSLDGRAYERLRCIQHWTSIDGEVPPEVRAAWDGRLYGCDSCLEACPFFRTDSGATTDLGHLGPVLPADWFIGNDDVRIRHNLAGSALDRAWISKEAFRRNARLAREVYSASEAGNIPRG
jgi:epoxyqueuosine reductase QueG